MQFITQIRSLLRVKRICRSLNQRGANYACVKFQWSPATPICLQIICGSSQTAMAGLSRARGTTWPKGVTYLLSSSLQKQFPTLVSVIVQQPLLPCPTLLKGRVCFSMSLLLGWALFLTLGDKMLGTWYELALWGLLSYYSLISGRRTGPWLACWPTENERRVQ